MRKCHFKYKNYLNEIAFSRAGPLSWNERAIRAHKEKFGARWMEIFLLQNDIPIWNMEFIGKFRKVCTFLESNPFSFRGDFWKYQILCSLLEQLQLHIISMNIVFKRSDKQLALNIQLFIHSCNLAKSRTKNQHKYLSHEPPPCIVYGYSSG